MSMVHTAGEHDGVRRGRSWIGLVAASALAFTGVSDAYGQDAKTAAPPAVDRKDKDDEEPKVEVDPAASHKTASLEIFRDPNMEQAQDLKKFPEIKSARPVTSQEIALLREMAGNQLSSVDVNVIQNVVAAEVGQLTNEANIKAIVDPANAADEAKGQAIGAATRALLEPIFMARASKNVNFQVKYNQVLLQKLAPLLKHHFIPRIQASIILGQSANPEALKTFLDEIKDPKQLVWVKHWALAGVTNIKLFSNRLSTAQEADAGKVIADQLLKNKDWPWVVQRKGLEALGTLRQGFLPTSPRTADMASAAFQFLADKSVKPDVRAEAALALGSMQVTNAVPKYNPEVAAYASAKLAADMLDTVATGFSGNPGRAQKTTAVVVGQLFQAFDGKPNARDAGFLHSPLLANPKDVQKYFDAIKPASKAAAALVNAPAGQVQALTADLGAKVKALRDFLAKTPPADMTLFQGGPSLPADGPPAQAAAEPAAQPKMAGNRGAK